MKTLSAASLRRLEQLERPRTERSGGVLLVPKLLSLIEWERQAVAYFASRAEAEAADRRESDAAYAKTLTTVAPFIPASYQPTTRN